MPIMSTEPPRQLCFVKERMGFAPAGRLFDSAFADAQAKK